MINYSCYKILIFFSDDGAVRIWRNYISDTIDCKELVTAFQAITDPIPLSKGSLPVVYIYLTNYTPVKMYDCYLCVTYILLIIPQLKCMIVMSV